ncbi:MAG: DNA polymerase III subunit beta [Betaproteobacteria bacterium]|nr:DNA polymerase III subunit beta [Betaproteobacteria bacterium]
MLLINTPKEALQAPLQAVCGIVERRQTLPILANVLLERHDDQLVLLATDIEMQIRTTAPGAAAGEPVAVTVGARKLQDILRALPDGCELSLLLEDKRLNVRSGKSRFSLQTLPAADFPRMAAADGQAVSLRVGQGAFRHLLAQVQYAMAQQDIRYYLNGLMLLVEGTELRAVATDGHRLAFARTHLETPLARAEVIVPRKTVIELSRLLADADHPLDIVLGAGQARFAFGDIELVTKLIDGKFPDYERVIPQGHPKVLRLGRQALQQALARVAILTNEKFRGVRLVLDEGSLRVLSTNADQEEAQEELETAYHGDPLDIGFNVTYLLDVLNNLTVSEVECRFADANSSALFTVPDDPDFSYVVMPMRI